MLPLCPNIRARIKLFYLQP